MTPTPTEAFGREAVEALALWAIDALVYPPERIDTFTTRIPAEEIRRGRRILEDQADIDWRKLKGDGRSQAAASRERSRTG